MNGNGLKPGIQTTECWGMLISQAIGVAVLFGWVKSGDAHSLEDALKQIIVASITVVGNVAIVYKYIHDRGVLKTFAITNQNGNSPSEVPLIGGGK